MSSGEFDFSVNSLIEQTKDGEKDAFDKIAEQYGPLIDSMVRKYATPGNDAEFEQEALIALYQAACTYDPNSRGVSFGLYAKICMRNGLISYYRSGIKKERASDTDEIEQTLVEPDDPIDDYLNRESFVLLDKFVKSQLSEYEYSVFRMYIEGYKVKEIATQMNRTEKSVEGAIMRLKMKLRSSFDKYDL